MFKIVSYLGMLALGLFGSVANCDVPLLVAILVMAALITCHVVRHHRVWTVKKPHSSS